MRAAGSSASPATRRANSCLPADKTVVEQRQSLSRHNQLRSPAATRHRAGSVQHGKQRQRSRSLDEQINTAPPLLGPVSLGADKIILVAARPGVGGNERFDRRAEHRQVQAAGNRQDRISLGFGLQPPRPAKIETGWRIDAGQFRRRADLLPIRGAHHDLAVQRFEPPAAFDQLASQPIEQLGIHRPLALAAKIVRRADDCLAEMVLPEAIDDHPGQQRTGTPLDVDNPTGQRGAAASSRPKDRRRGARDRFAHRESARRESRPRRARACSADRRARARSWGSAPAACRSTAGAKGRCGSAPNPRA